MTNRPTAPTNREQWMAVVRPYQSADARLAAGQLLNTFGPLLALFWLSHRLLAVHPLWSLLVSLPLAGLLVRVFIIQHDCGHGSFLPGRRWNDRVGLLCSLLTLTPYAAWRRDHAIHHATAGNLDHRGTGDIKTVTIDEFVAMAWRQRLVYRLYRHPLVLFGIGPAVHFVLFQRLPWSAPKEDRAERISIHLTNAALLLAAWGLSSWIGWRALLWVWLPPAVLAASAGVWLFYVQHQFDAAYWQREPDWEYSAVALEGSSYYALPRWLQWFTGNIGLHHVHHLSPRIPNYRLQQCHDENPIFHTAPRMGLRESLRTVPLALWDEAGQRLISFRQARRLGLLVD